MSTAEPEGAHHVQSLARGLAVITAFDREHPAMTLTEVAQRTGLTRATARRFLLTLVDLGFVRLDGTRFSLTPQVLRLGTAYLSGLDLPQIAQPHLERLSASLHESTSAAVLDGTDIVYVARVSTRRIMSVGITVGTRFPAHATSMGRVLLAHLPAVELDDYFARAALPALTDATVHDEATLRQVLAQVREQGWAGVEQELEPGLASVAAPLRRADGTVVAAINVSATYSGRPLPEEYRDEVLATAEAISADLAVAPHAVR
jgi:IclR family pca regulon transcriptional regulator